MTLYPCKKTFTEKTSPPAKIRRPVRRSGRPHKRPEEASSAKGLRRFRVPVKIFPRRKITRELTDAPDNQDHGDRKKQHARVAKGGFFPIDCAAPNAQHQHREIS